MARIHDAPCHYNRRNSRQNLHIWLNFMCFFRFWLCCMLPLGWNFGFNIIALHPWFVTSYNLFKQIWIIVERHQHILTNATAVFAQNLAILEQSSLSHISCLKHPQKLLSMSRTICQNHQQPLYNSDSTIIQNYFLYFNVFIGCWCARAVTSQLTSSLTSSRPSLNRLRYNRTCVLLIVDSPNVTVNISNVLAHIISFFTQNLIEFLWSIFETNLFICQKQTDNPKWLILSTYMIEMCSKHFEKFTKF